MRLAHHVQQLRAADSGTRRIVARYSDGLDSRVVRAACLAHDLGHPPFGHIAERALQKILAPNLASNEEERRAAPARYQLADSFEGNAQSFRIVTKLAFRESSSTESAAALDLTRASLRALSKYPWRKGELLDPTNPSFNDKRDYKWGAYDSELRIFEWARGPADGRIVNVHSEERVEYRNLEAQIMDWADDISYAVHDAEDFFRAGLIPMQALRNSSVELNTFFNAAWIRLGPTLNGVIDIEDARRAFKAVVRSLFPLHAFNGSRSDRELLHAFASSIIAKSVQGLAVGDGGILIVPRAQLAVVELLKEMTWFYVIKRPALSSAQVGQVKVIRDLYFGLTQWIAEEGGDLARLVDNRGDHIRWPLPTRLGDYIRVAFSEDVSVGCVGYKFVDQKVSRAVVDYISSLTESQALAMRARIRGLGIPSMLDHWVEV